MKKVEIVVGCNYGDEGKGLLTRYFAREAARNNEKAIVVFSQGTAQRGHTVDYNPHFRHVYHHFGSGTGDGVPTFFSDTFWIHPMAFAHEYREIVDTMGIKPKVYCDIEVRVITPFDMLVDHATMAWIALQNGEREYGTCGLGSWCAIESRGRNDVFCLGAYLPEYNTYKIRLLLEDTWNKCIAILLARGVDVEKLPEYREYFEPNSLKKEQLITHFIKDLQFFTSNVIISNFDHVYPSFDNIIFENGQGLGLDMDVDNDWHTTSKTGIFNPVKLLKDKKDFNAEVCYVTRSYLTRHGVGPLEESVNKKEINGDMIDRTNEPNEFQGALRYGFIEDKAQAERIKADWDLVSGDARFKKEIAVTHCNEFKTDLITKYCSYNPYSVLRNE